MSTPDDRYDQIMRSYQLRRANDRVPAREACEPARGLLKWIDGRFSFVDQEPAVEAIEAAKFDLLEKYFDWYQAVTDEHRRTIPAADRHVCLLEVFQAAYFYLDDLDLHVRRGIPAPKESAAARREPVSWRILKARGIDIEVTDPE